MIKNKHVTLMKIILTTGNLKSISKLLLIDLLFHASFPTLSHYCQSKWLIRF